MPPGAASAARVFNANGVASAAELRKKSLRLINKNHTRYDGGDPLMTKYSLAFIALLSALCAASCSKVVPPLPNETAPATFAVTLDTTRGPVQIAVTRAEAPVGADRFYNLVKTKFFDGARFFRVVPGFVVQFGVAADPKVTAQWDVPIQDDPVVVSNTRGTICFAAASAPNTRTTQLFINLGNNQRLDAQGFAVFGTVTSGMDAVDHIYSGYGQKPDQTRIEKEGNAYLQQDFPSLDYIKTARIGD
jgi:peptidyl-prolyl cis-trans isomerase A (cyclophilin A)